MSILFYLVLLLLVSGVAGAMYCFSEWIYHGHKYPTMLLWSLGFLFLNWYQIPTLMALSGAELVLSNFNSIYAIGLPLTFLGVGLIYFGGRLMLGNVKKLPVFLFACWAVIAFVFYGFYYRDTILIESFTPIAGSNILFFGPIFLLNLSVGIALFKKARQIKMLSLKIGSLTYIAASCLGIARCVVSVGFVLMHPLTLAPIRFFYSPLIVAQVLGLGFLLITFYLLHKSIKALRAKS